jgi:hypothetical protein
MIIEIGIIVVALAAYEAIASYRARFGNWNDKDPKGFGRGKR